MNNIWFDVGISSVNKLGEQLCGDHVDVVKMEDGSKIVVLADGLGSGVKASILSILTAKIISTMMANQMSLEDCVQTIIHTLPVCKERQLAYSTFSFLYLHANSRMVDVVQYDNPKVLFFHDGKHVRYNETVEIIDGKQISRTRLELQEGDYILMMSDGVLFASKGKILDLDWNEEKITTYMEQTLQLQENFDAKTFSSLLLQECLHHYDDKPGDDISVCAIRLCKRKNANILIGPPKNPDDVDKMMRLFFSRDGYHLVCGGTTSQLCAKYLGKPIKMNQPYPHTDVPPTCTIEGVDLVSEGSVTLKQVLAYAKDHTDKNEQYTYWTYQDDGASKIAKLLFDEVSDIHFYVGLAKNPAHNENDSQSISFGNKMEMIEQLVGELLKLDKKVKVNYF
ncbi:serine/threonine protein phosphatase [Erysipelotrichaceae bacterium MTC7]|nr:serine/threonine protein phosphatase [Erysipelotrichaceae bacterium MTC7]